MSVQSYVIGQESTYRALPRTTRPPGNAAQSPKVVSLAGGKLQAEVHCDLVGRYDRSGAVSERELFKLKHDIPGDRATLEVQRFVRAVRVQGGQIHHTSGTGYLHWAAPSALPEGRGLQAICASQIHAAFYQDDGPRGVGKVMEAPDRMGLVIRDAPGMAATGPDDFPYALMADFIMRVIVRPKVGSAEAAEFRYQVFFELPNDPYPAGMRDAAFVPRTAEYHDYRSFLDIAQHFQAEHGRSLQAAPALRPRKVAATTDDLAVPVRRKFTDPY